jgi:putative ABC transport system permease protein
MVVSQALAKVAWPNENPIGKRIACCEGDASDPRLKTVIGVATDVHTGGPTQEIRPEFYIPISQAPQEAWRWVNRSVTVVLRSRADDPTTLAPTLRAVMRSIDPMAPVYNVTTMTQYLSRSVAEPRFHLALLLSLGVVGLLLAAAGIYSVISYFVALRTHEIGVRMALGATSSDVVRFLMVGGLRPVMVGAALGSVVAMWATRLLRGSLYGVASSDPETFASVIIVLMLVAIIAILIPARRATSVDPTTALHG